MQAYGKISSESSNWLALFGMWQVENKEIALSFVAGLDVLASDERQGCSVAPAWLETLDCVKTAAVVVSTATEGCGCSSDEDSGPTTESGKADPGTRLEDEVRVRRWGS